MRLYPHLQNTGGFFVALFRKTKALPPPAPYTEEAPDAEQQSMSKETPKEKSYNELSKTELRYEKWFQQAADGIGNTIKKTMEKSKKRKKAGEKPIKADYIPKWQRPCS